MDDGGNTRDDLKVPEGDLGNEIRSSVDDGKDILVRIVYVFLSHGDIFIGASLTSSALSSLPVARRP